MNLITSLYKAGFVFVTYEPKLTAFSKLSCRYVIVKLDQNTSAGLRNENIVRI